MTDNADGLGARRFEEIEGLRGWLSWTVVFWHIIQYTGLNGHYRVLGSAAGLAHLAVEMFIILSGFVVTHLLLSRKEPYVRYLSRRAFRLFPLYLIGAVTGIFATGLAAQAVGHVPWAHDPAFTYGKTLIATYASQQAYFPLHAFLHMVLLQGAVPDSILPYSSAALIGPAWSLSLEWQFYLIAPLLIGGLASRRWWAVTLMAIVGAYLAHQTGILGSYRLMSSFPSASLLFLTGIVSRLRFGWLGRVIRSPTPVALAGLAAASIPALTAFGLWVAFFAFLVSNNQNNGKGTGIMARSWAAMFGSRIARLIGARSYGVYVVHWPLLQIILFMLQDEFGANLTISACMLAAALIPATIVIAELLHHAVERPMIRLGSQLVSRKNSLLAHQLRLDIPAQRGEG
ncbi:acyltransferase family protein [Rhizorhabdus argentea]|uniref:acyltransferase family protein n=1 Tax=Rhizorhabdus argentea TaxID=1387174 RepID=UPI0030EE3CF5